MKDWEDAQARRGGLDPTDPQSLAQEVSIPYLDLLISRLTRVFGRIRHINLDPVRPLSCTAPLLSYRLLSIVPNVTSLPTLAAAMSRLSGTLSNAQTAHTAHENSVEAIQAEQEQLSSKELEMRDLVTNAEAKRAWLSDFHEWMETIATFLDEKVSLCCQPSV